MGNAASVRLPEVLDLAIMDSVLADKHVDSKDVEEYHALFSLNKDSHGMISKVNAFRIMNQNKQKLHIKDEFEEDKLAMITEALVDDKSISLISFENFKSQGKYPRYSEKLVTTLDKINKSNSLIVFISHTWCHLTGSESGWDNNKHYPDNKTAEQHQLCVRGIEHLLRSAAPGMTECYIWCDYCCLDQDIIEHSATNLVNLHQIIHCCDCLFTPIYDNDESWELPSVLQNYYEDYKSLPWNGEQSSAYLKRAWCRVEMFYSANIPLYPHSDQEERMKKFVGRMQHNASGGYRPHALYGSFECRVSLPPIIMPPLQMWYYDQYNPEHGHVSNNSDKEIIKLLCVNLKQYHNPILTMGYVGEYNEAGEMHGHGTYRYENGDIYIGDWVDGLKHGVGIYKNKTGEIYEGEYNGDVREGLCKYRYADGSTYYGEMRHEKKNGHGIYEYANGDIFEGEFHRNHRTGQGVLRYKNGDVFEGHFKHDVRHGKGVFKESNGTVIEGTWKDDHIVSEKHNNSKAKDK